MTIELGDEISWINPETGQRLFGTVLAKRDTYYIVSDGWRAAKALKPGEITKECG